ncbi:hypothetical protein [Amycolatopsis sp. FDAARGOS 1241]|uniref:Rv1733c family protein n=1 Tax=Amycolatopsis sp. FDAARGOS 1241 TaxID=2778070 RepID=UPI00194DD927|nr:hypothetical protein [Amycolatopsis sp. FDAARGOS 1241]QRP50359.1 hypothetical protein I6J71_23320 [Amycolatopsis sp. FDAARGOS 1241]
MNPPANRRPRWRHLLVPGRGSVARTSDRVQAGLLLLVVLLTLAAVPALATAGSAFSVAQKQQSARELGERRPATATLLADGPPDSVAGRSGEARPPAPADAMWSGPGGERHFGLVDAPAGSRRGDQVPIWLDRSGAPVAAPLSAVAAVVNAVCAAIGLYFVTCLALALVYGGAALALNRYRAGRWQREWYSELAKRSRS